LIKKKWGLTILNKNIKKITYSKRRVKNYYFIDPNFSILSSMYNPYIFIKKTA